MVSCARTKTKNVARTCIPARRIAYVSAWQQQGLLCYVRRSTGNLAHSTIERAVGPKSCARERRRRASLSEAGDSTPPQLQIVQQSGGREEWSIHISVVQNLGCPACCRTPLQSLVGDWVLDTSAHERGLSLQQQNDKDQNGG